MKKEENNVEEIFAKITELKEKYQYEINNSTNVNRIFQEISYYYRDLILMGYTLNTMASCDRQYLDYLEKRLEKEAKEYRENGKYEDLNNQINLICKMDLSDEIKKIIIKSLYDFYNIQYDQTSETEDKNEKHIEKKYSKKKNC